MTDHQGAELKPCPFCGGSAEITERDVEPQGDPWYGKRLETFVVCGCGACLFDGGFHEGFYDPETRAIAAWNRRPAPAAGGDGLPNVVRTAPERIYLVIGEDAEPGVDFGSLGELTWCADKIDDNCIEYVRADQMRQYARDALAAGAPQWLPIEQAPKDGTRVVLGNAHGVWAGFYQPVFASGFRPDNPWSSLLLNHDHIPSAYRSLRPTRFMPLPAAPGGIEYLPEKDPRGLASLRGIATGALGSISSHEYIDKVRNDDWPAAEGGGEDRE